MDPGLLRHRITIQQKTRVQNEYGEEIADWVDVASVWASVNPISGREFFAAEAVNSEVTHKINMRYRSGITPDMRVKFKERYFQIIAVMNLQEKNAELQLLCKELV
ncbi:phage head closure protein [Geobacillus sp. FJAT-46040]|uniref:phage head closure protein n=1 Tax=Geobacillus sp. FJAT-46040 TaxID=2011017 RepID=UPI000BB8D2D8|nr:phage head closure protein [Geobacillus sp. FJAT-46040]